MLRLLQAHAPNTRHVATWLKWKHNFFAKKWLATIQQNCHSSEALFPGSPAFVTACFRLDVSTLSIMLPLAVTISKVCRSRLISPVPIEVKSGYKLQDIHTPSGIQTSDETA